VSPQVSPLPGQLQSVEQPETTKTPAASQALNPKPPVEQPETTKFPAASQALNPKPPVPGVDGKVSPLPDQSQSEVEVGSGQQHDVHEADEKDDDANDDKDSKKTNQDSDKSWLKKNAFVVGSVSVLGLTGVVALVFLYLAACTGDEADNGMSTDDEE